MILDKKVEIIWNYNNKKYYINKYIFTKFGDSFFIKIDDLIKTSHTKIHVKCDICGKENYIVYYSYIKSINNCNYYACSRNCSKNKYIATNIKKYGVENPSQNKEIRNKFEKTCLKKYGVRFPSQSKIVKEQKKITSLKHYGVENPTQNKEIKEKTKQTNLKKYGVENPMQNKEIRNKLEKTCLRKYGVKNPMQNKEVKEKAKQTNLKKYGVNCPSQNKEIAKKGLETIIRRYGEIWLKHVPTYNANSIIYLDMISERLGLPIQHALNGGEKKFVRYWIDGFIEKYNICIEWNEKFHNCKKFKEKDIIKEKFIIENFNCYYIKINQDEFMNDIDGQINIILNKINTIISDSITKTSVI